MNEENLSNIIVVKRDGKKVDFDGTKIALAIKKGFDSICVEDEENKYNEIINQIASLEQKAEELPLNREKVLKKINNMTVQNSDKDN